MPNVLHADRRMHPTVYVATMRNWVYAFDAEDPKAEEPLWSVKLADSVDHDFFPMVFWFSGRYNIDPDIGITSTPVIDLDTNTIYVVAKVKTSGWIILHWFEKVAYRLYALDTRSGEQKPGSPVDIQAKVPGYGRGSKGGSVAFDPVRQLQRPALLLVKTPASSNVYLGFGSHQDTNPYHGWVLAYDGKSLQQTAAYCTSCANLHSSEAGIWQAGSGLASDDDGHVYLLTGNVPAQSEPEDLADSELGNSFVRLSPDLRVLDWFTPANYQCLNETDADLGSSGPMLIKNTNLLIGGGKEGVLYLLRRDQLGKVGKPSTDKDQQPCENHFKPARLEAPAQSFQGSLPWEDPHTFFEFFSRLVLAWGYHHIHGAPVYFADAQGPIIYIWPERDSLRGYRMDPTDQSFHNVADPGRDPQSTYTGEIQAGQGMPGASLAASANGNDPSTALIWASLPARDDALTAIVDGVLRVFEAVPQGGGSRLQQLWSSDDNPGDSTGKFAKYVPPTVANGRIYLASFSGELHVFGLRDAGVAAAPGRPLSAVNRPTRSEPPPAYDGAHRMGGMSETPEDPAGAAFVRQTPPPLKMHPGQGTSVSVTMRNTGSEAWSPTDRVLLVAQHPSNNKTWTREGEQKLPDKVPLGGEVTIAFDITAPREGRFHFQWEMARDGHFFGERSPDVIVDVEEPECDVIRARRDELLSHSKSRKLVQLERLAPEAQQELTANANEMSALDERAEKKGCALQRDQTHGSAGFPR